MNRKSIIISASMVFVISFLIRLFNVLRFPILPTAFDPWYHMSIVESVVSDGYINLDVYRGGVLLHILTAIIHMVTGINVFTLVKYLPILLGSITVFCLYFLVKNITDNFKIIVFSMFFLAAISFSFIFASNQFWPELLTIPLMILSVGFFIETHSKRRIRDMLLSIFFFVCIALTHDFSAVMALITLAFTFIFISVGSNRFSLSSAIILLACFSVLSVWSLGFITASVLAEIISRLYLLIPASAASLLIVVYFFRRIRVGGSFETVHVSKLTYALWIFFSLTGLTLTLIVTQIPPFSYTITPTEEYLMLAVPGTTIFLSLISLGSLILFQNFNFQASIVVGVIAGPAVTILLPYSLYLYSLPLIEAERVLEFASIGGSLICGVALSFIFTSIFRSNNSNIKKIKAVITISSIVFAIVPAVLWAYPNPSGGLRYLNWNTYSENDFALWAAIHLKDQTIISDWRIGYILTGFMPAPSDYPIVIDALLLYFNNYSEVFLIPRNLGVYLVLDDWMIYNGPTQPPSYGPTIPLLETKIVYETNSSYTKIYDNGYEWIYFIP